MTNYARQSKPKLVQSGYNGSKADDALDNKVWQENVKDSVSDEIEEYETEHKFPTRLLNFGPRPRKAQKSPLVLD